MNGLSEEQIRKNRESAISYLKEKGYEIVDTIFSDDFQREMKEGSIAHVPVKYLAKSIDFMANCHAVYFLSGWENARGCRIEHSIAQDYGLEIIEE